jgi:cytochrome c oxidase cbb3-type subunit III
MKFSTYLEQIMGVSIFPVISLMLFVAFFTGVLVWIYSIDKKEIEHMENLPLND